MISINSIVLYVANVSKSTQFYESLLGQSPVESFKDFCLFELSDGFMLGLQAKHAIDPKPQPTFGGFELCLADISKREVDEAYAFFNRKSVEIVMEPTELEFGYTFVACDPDGHRIRLCATDTTGIE